VRWFRPLESVADSKHDKSSSAEGRAFNKVEELRVKAANSWSTSPHSLTLIVILKRDVLPTFPNDEFPDKPATFDDDIRPNGRLESADFIAGRLEAATDPVEIYWLWESLAEAWAAKCTPKKSELKKLSNDDRARIMAVIQGGEVGYDLTTVDEFSMYEYKHSEMLDLDYLSPSEPLLEGQGDLAGLLRRDVADPSSNREPSSPSKVMRLLSLLRQWIHR